MSMKRESIIVGLLFIFVFFVLITNVDAGNSYDVIFNSDSELKNCLQKTESTGQTLNITTESYAPKGMLKYEEVQKVTFLNCSGYNLTQDDVSLIENNFGEITSLNLSNTNITSFDMITNLNKITSDNLNISGNDFSSKYATNETNIKFDQNILLPSSYNLIGVTYSSNDTSIATVDSNGNIKALKSGTVIITKKFSINNNGEITDKNTITISDKAFTKEDNATNKDNNTTTNTTSPNNNSTNGSQTVKVGNTAMRASFIGFCVGLAIMVMGIMVIYQSVRKTKETEEK